MPARYLVTSALPYANGPIHFGHLAGAYLNADIFVRYKRLTGAEVLFVCGTDEHGAPILVNAEKEGAHPRDYTDRWHQAIKQSFERVDIAFDHFSRTSRPVHYELTQHFFRRLVERGAITTRVDDQVYCEVCKRELPDRFVVGTCPKCDFDAARGDECPRCAAAFDATELKAPRCKTCGTNASKRPSKHWYLDLPALRPELEAWLEARFPAWKPNVVGEVKKYLADLKPRPITRDLQWGVPVPLEEAKDRVFYVWFDAPIGYISSTREWAAQQGKPDDEWERWWKDPGTQLVHFIGKDNIAFHAVIFPSMLLGQREGYVLPDVPANEFLNLEGQKFSTSGGWFIAIDDFVDRFPADTLRWTLTRSAPETRDSDFTYKDFQTRVNAELLGTFGNFASRVLKFVQARHQGAVPAAQADPGEPERRALEALRAGVAAAAAELDRYSTRGAAERVLEVGYAANKLIEERQPFKLINTDPAAAATTINVAVRLLEGLAVLLFPFVPGTATRLWAQLGLEGDPTRRRWQDAAEPADPAGRAIGALDQHLFQRVEDKTVEAEVARLRAGATPPPEKAAAPPAAPAKAEAPAAAGKPPISFDAFAALDLRVAKVVSAEAVPKADKLLRLELELAGGERRTVLSGIRAWYPPEALVGRQVVYLANLEPKKIRGVVSQGMVLAANDVGDVAVLLQPERGVPDGARVS
ncbi:MAG: methionine--tRNA ligase [Planctomycetes bacterium]|nr:methionine--tRNA ligase [Planctomycetota bacterium]